MVVLYNSTTTTCCIFYGDDIPDAENTGMVVGNFQKGRGKEKEKKKRKWKVKKDLKRKVHKKERKENVRSIKYFTFLFFFTERPIKKSQKIGFFYKAKELEHACSVCF